MVRSPISKTVLIEIAEFVRQIGWLEYCALLD